MSRLDFHDFSYPPGVAYARSAAEIDHHITNHYPSNSPTHPASGDRHMSNGLGVYLPSSSSSALIPRSIGIHPDKEYSGIGIIPEAFQVAPNRHTSTQHLSSSNHHRPPPIPHNSSPAALSINTNYYNAPSDAEREGYLHHQLQSFASSGDLALPANSNSGPNLLRSTLWWGELEPWMDEEYAKQVCALMGWDPVTVKVPNAGPDAVAPTNNSGYCYLTFPSPAIASSVLNQVNGGGSAQPVTMPNSNKPFVLSWASSAPIGPIASSFQTTTGVIVPTAQPQFPKEYSIFVGDLAPETSNSDLVAVFRNPVLGLRNDREPKFIRPFLSCKSAKIMLDPVTGISRGYGFVRFTEEADQQRALIEMHGLYCLSRPMRISPATAKFKPPPMPTDLPQIQFPGSPTSDQRSNPATVAVPLGGQPRSVSAPMAASTSAGSSSSLASVPVGPSVSGSTLSGSSSIPSLGSETSTTASSGALSSMSSDEMLGLSANVLALAHQYANGSSTTNVKGIAPSASIHDSQDHSVAPRYIISEESWKHHAQARAILGNLIGPNGEQLTSTDPYNTTVFVGGLSPLISEETLRTFFTPFGEIHYVKVPVGKHCGFVQFVRKADAERAIEKMQGFPIGGSRIRLSWGRSQYKAAQAAAQAAQAAALQAQFQAQMASAQGQAPQSQMTPEQAIQLLQRLGLSGQGSGYSEEKLRSLIMNQPLSDSQLSYDAYPRPPSNTSSVEHHRSHLTSSFSPFSPEPNMYTRRGSDSYDLLPHSMNHTSRYDGIMEFKAATTNSNERPVPPVRTPSGSQRYVPFLDGSAKAFEGGRCMTRQEPISRPNSSQTSSQGRSSQYDVQEHDPIHDLNGTLASLDLDQHHTHPSSSSS
ncbi:hypothetical protein BDR04DRAFT_1009972 [Suillus decipiens]|nr:hypothetical protein BDR04DRAFT_1009972 [Suillus decipiens]